MAIERKDTLQAELEKLANETEEHEHCHHHDGEDHCHDEHDDEDEDEHHHDDEDEHDHCCHHHDEYEHCHHGDDDDDNCCHHEHEHDHEHDHEHGGHCHHHHADEVFTSWGVETSKSFTAEGLNKKLSALASGEYGQVLRAKGIVAGDGNWLYFDYVPGEPDIREGTPGVTGRLCVIGCQLNEDKLKALFLE